MFILWKTYESAFIMIYSICLFYEAMCSGVGDLMANEDENVEASKNIEGFRSSAREMLHRINLLEKRKVKVKHASDTCICQV